MTPAADTRPSRSRTGPGWDSRPYLADPHMRRATRRWLAVGVCAWLAVMTWGASPRNVGDSSEYLGMALNLAGGRPPSLSDGELRGLASASSQPGAGFELETRRIPEMLGRDGRYDMPHTWVYSLIAT